MNKRIFFMLFCMVLLIGSVSAAIPLFNQKEYDTQTKTATIRNWFGLGTEVATIKLTDNTDYCLINCEAVMYVDLNTETKGSTLFERVRFFDTNRKLTEIKSYEIWVKGGRTEIIQSPVYKEVCGLDKNATMICEWKINGYKNNTVEVNRWELFDDNENYFGELQIKIKGKKDRSKSIEWIPHYLDNDIDEWAWWDSGWTRKKQVNISENSNTDMSNYSVRMVVTYDSDMQVDFDDIRFVNGTENTELGYYLINKTDSNHAVFDVFVDEGLKANTNTTVYMYYDNAGATSTSEGEEAYNFYDNFSLDSRTTKWTMSGGASEVNDSMLRLNLTGGDKYIYTQFSINVSDGWLVKFDKYINIWSATAGEVMEWGIGSTQKGNSNLPHMFYYRDGAPTRTLYYGNSSDEESMTHKFNETASKWIIQELLYTPTNYTWFENSASNYTNGTLVNSNFYGSPTFKNELIFRRAGASAAQTEELYIANVSIRRFTRPEPTVVFGSEEIGITVDQLFPPDEANYTTTRDVEFQCNFSIGAGTLGTGILYLNYNNNSFYLSNASSLSGSAAMQNWTFTMPNGDGHKFKWFCFGNSSDNTISLSTSNRTLNVTATYTVTPFSDQSVVGEGADVIFTLYINKTNLKTDYVNTYAILNLNHTSYDDPVTTKENDYYKFVKTITVPEGWGVGGGRNIPWNWSYAITNGDILQNKTTANSTLTVYTMDLNVCGGAYNQTVLNISLRDEATDTLISYNGTTNRTTEVGIDVDVTNRDGSKTWTYFSNFTNTTEFSICVPYEIINTTEYSMDFIADYESKTDYVNEFLYFDNYNLTLSSAPKFVYLRNLLSADSTTFIVSYENEDGALVKDVVISLLRDYVGNGTFKEVEAGKTNNDGETLLHFVEEDVIYKFNVSINGVQDYLSEPYRVYCVAGEECRISLQKLGDVPSFPDDWDQLAIGTYNISSNQTTRFITLAFNLNQSAVINLSVFEYTENQSQADILIGQNSATMGSGYGERTLYIPLSYGNTSFYYVIYSDDAFVASGWTSLKEQAQDYFGSSGMVIFLVALIIMALALMAISQGTGMIIFAIFGLIIVSILQLVTLPYGILIYIIISGFIIIIKLGRRR